MRQQGRHCWDAFLGDDAWEVANHHGVRVGADDGGDDVEGVAPIGDPVADGFVQGVFERLAARFNRHHGGTQLF